MRKPFTAFCCACLVTAALLLPCLSQSTARGRRRAVLTNAEVVRLVRRGVSEAVVIERIRRSRPRFDISRRALRRLRDAGVSEAVIDEMVRTQRDASTPHAAGGREGAPCLPASGGADSSGDRQTPASLPPSRFDDSIAADESSTHRLPPAPGSAQTSGGMTKQMRVGVVRPLAPSLDISAVGRCFDLGHGTDEIMAVVSEGARQVRVRFASVSIPRGAKLYVSSLRDRAEVYGPYEGRGPSGDGAFWTPPVEGDGVVIEYYSPRSAPGREGRSAPFRVVEVSHVYANPNRR